MSVVVIDRHNSRPKKDFFYCCFRVLYPGMYVSFFKLMIHLSKSQEFWMRWNFSWRQKKVVRCKEVTVNGRKGWNDTCSFLRVQHFSFSKNAYVSMYKSKCINKEQRITSFNLSPFILKKILRFVHTVRQSLIIWPLWRVLMLWQSERD